MFIVEYADGRTALISISRFRLRAGDHVARGIAAEWQAGGQIPPGTIAHVRRV